LGFWGGIGEVQMVFVFGQIYVYALFHVYPIEFQLQD